MTRQVTEFLLYRWRYILGYMLVGAVLGILLILAGLYAPGGITTSEMSIAVRSSLVSYDHFDPSMIVNLPYSLLQKAIFSTFGVTLLSIKIPSLIIGFLSIFGLLPLFILWFRQNVAIITIGLIITTGQFLFIAQSGTPGIMFIFYAVWILLAATMLSRRARFPILWKILLFVLVALSLYTPLSIYMIVALAVAAALHPHLRYLIRRLPPTQVAIAATLSVIIFAPLGYALLKDPSTSLLLLGIPSAWPSLADNLTSLLRQYFDFTTPHSGVVIAPVYGMGSMALILLGIFRLFTVKYTARSYIIGIWFLFIIPVVILSPKYANILFVPMALLLAMGVRTLIIYWYQLFPRNPYARIVGLIPLTILIASMTISGAERYMYGYHYDPMIARNFSQDIQLVNNQSPKYKSITLVVSGDEKPFYDVLAKYNSKFIVEQSFPSNNTAVLVSKDVRFLAPLSQEPDQIITDRQSTDSNRFYLYKNGLE
ncbi:MAG: hypothetical protein ABIQ04_02960 [Candidatus Saccharimonadales bacterium]